MKPKEPQTPAEQEEEREVPIQDYTPEEVDKKVQRSNALVKELDSIWEGLHTLTSERRAKSRGKMAFAMGEMFAKLFEVLLPPSVLTVQEEAELTPKQKQDRSLRIKLLDVFHTTLGHQDHGLNPDIFEVELLRNRQYRAIRQHELSEKLATLARNLNDDALVVGEKVVDPGLKAFKFAKNLAEHHDVFDALLSPVMDIAQKMTSDARKAQAEKRDEALVAKAAKKLKKGQEPGGEGGSSST